MFSSCLRFDLKSTKSRFCGSSEPESPLFSIPPTPGHLCGPYCKIIARTDHRNLAVFRGTSEHAPWLALRSGRGAKNKFFFSIERRHRTKPPSQAGVGFRLGSVSHSWFCLSQIQHELKLRRNQGPAFWGVRESRGGRLSISRYKTGKLIEALSQCMYVEWRFLMQLLRLSVMWHESRANATQSGSLGYCTKTPTRRRRDEALRRRGHGAPTMAARM